MLVMLPSSVRTDRGAAFVTALPLIPQHATALDAVELRPDGTMCNVITLNGTQTDALHDTTQEALEAATPQMRRTAHDLERFALRPGVALSAAVDNVRNMHRKATEPQAGSQTRAEDNVST